MRDDLAEQARAWAEASCAAQGLATKVKDPVVLAQVVALLTGGSEKDEEDASGQDEPIAKPQRTRRAT